MGDDHPNTVAYLRTVEAFSDGDFETIASLIAEDFVWHLPGDHPLAGDWEGRDRLFQLLEAGSAPVHHPRTRRLRRRRPHVRAQLHQRAPRRVGCRDAGRQRLPLPRRPADRAMVLPGRRGRLEQDLPGLGRDLRPKESSMSCSRVAVDSRLDTTWLLVAISGHARRFESPSSRTVSPNTFGRSSRAARSSFWTGTGRSRGSCRCRQPEDRSV